MELTKPDQALCSDIAYIYTEEGFIYLSLVTDIFAKDVAGWAMSGTLETDSGPLEALKMAAETVGGRQGGSGAFRQGVPVRFTRIPCATRRPRMEVKHDRGVALLRKRNGGTA